MDLTFTPEAPVISALNRHSRATRHSRESGNSVAVIGNVDGTFKDVPPDAVRTHSPTINED